MNKISNTNAHSTDIKNAYHAMALDEHRRPFDITLWSFPADEDAAVIPTSTTSAVEMRKKYLKLRDTHGVIEAELSETWGELVNAEMAEELKGAKSNLLQVWFPGVHINVGGGSDDLLKDKKGDFERKSAHCSAQGHCSCTMSPSSFESSHPRSCSALA